MPLYEYRCPNCRRTFETLRSIAERDTPAECPKCATVSQDRQLSTFAAHASSGAFSGSGTYTGASCELPSCCGGTCSLN